MRPVSREEEEDDGISYADVLNAFADGKKHRIADLAASMDLDTWGKTTLRVIASSLYRSGRLARLEPGVYRLARVEPPTAEVTLATESERMVDAAVAMLLALSPSERSIAITRAEREDEGMPGLFPIRADALAVTGEHHVEEAILPPWPPLHQETPAASEKQQTLKLTKRVLACYSSGPRRTAEVISELFGNDATSKERNITRNTISNLSHRGLLKWLERGRHQLVLVVEKRLKPNSLKLRPEHPRSNVGLASDDHEDWPLVELIRAGDKTASETMLRKHDGILHVVCRRYRSDKVPYDDLMQEARLGFLHGLRKAEKGRGGNPITYSVFWVRAFVGRYFENHASDVRVPNHLHGKKRQQSADGLKLLHSVSMDQPLPGSDGERTYEDTLRAPPTAPDDDEVIEAARYEVLRLDMRKLVDELPAREAEVIRSRFLADDELTLDEVGAKLGLSGERVRQIQNDALARLGRLRDRNSIEPVAMKREAAPVAVSSTKIGRVSLSLARGRSKKTKAPGLDDRSLGPLVTRPPARRSS